MCALHQLTVSSVSSTHIAALSQRISVVRLWCTDTAQDEDVEMEDAEDDEEQEADMEDDGGPIKGPEDEVEVDKATGGHICGVVFNEKVAARH